MNSEYPDDYESDGSDLVKDLRKQLKEQSARFKELEEELTGFKKANHTSKLSTALSEAGYPETVAKFIPEDMPLEDLDQWLEENGSAFTKAEAVVQAEAEEQPDADLVAENRKINNIAEAAIPVQKMEEFSNRIAQAESDDEVNKIMQEAKKFVL